MNNEVKGRGLRINVAYVADDSRPVDAAAAPAAVARTGGAFSPGAGTAPAGKQIDQLGLTAPSTRSSSSGVPAPSSSPWARNNLDRHASIIVTTFIAGAS